MGKTAITGTVGLRGSPFVFGAPHAIPLEERFIGSDIEDPKKRRSGDHYVAQLVEYIRSKIGGISVVCHHADCDPNKNLKYNRKRYGTEKSAYDYVDTILDQLNRFQGVMFFEIHVAGNPFVRKGELRIRHDIEISTGNEEHQDFAQTIAQAMTNGGGFNVSGDWDAIHYRGAGNGRIPHNSLLRFCWKKGIPAVQIEFSPRMVYPEWDAYVGNGHTPQAYIASIKGRSCADPAREALNGFYEFLREKI